MTPGAGSAQAGCLPRRCGRWPAPARGRAAARAPAPAPSGHTAGGGGWAGNWASCKITGVAVTCYMSHLPWRPLNLNVSFHRRFQLPAILFTQQIKDLYVPENIVGEFLHSCKYFRGICKSIKNDIFGLENNLYLHYSHKGVIISVKETISNLQNWHTCKTLKGTLPCNLPICVVLLT